MTLRILHVATRHRVGGAERNLLHTVSRELDRGFDVHVAVGTEDLEDDFPSETRVHPLPQLVREVSPRADRRAFSDLQKLIRAFRFDVVQTHQSKAGAVGRAAARQAVPVVVHTVHMASFGPAYGRGQSAMFLALERWLARFTDRFVFVGAELRRRYEAAGVVAGGRSVVVHSPIMNLEALVELRGCKSDRRERARRAIKIPAGRRVVVMIGALDRRKRHALAIEALSPLLAGGETQLVIAGQGPELEALEDLSSRLGVADAVRFVGYVEDVRTLFAAADVFVQASTLEGVPQTVVQALAAGVPAIATAVDGLREIAAPAPRLSILPSDGRGLAALVSARLATGPIEPARAELLARWLPGTVDAQLDHLHRWMEVRVGYDRPPLAEGQLPPAPLRAKLPPKEAAVR